MSILEMVKHIIEDGRTEDEAFIIAGELLLMDFEGDDY